MLPEFLEKDLVHFLPLVNNHNNSPRAAQKGLGDRVFA